MATITVAKLISDWELLHTSLQPHLTDMPFLKDQATQLEALIVAEARRVEPSSRQTPASPIDSWS